MRARERRRQADTSVEKRLFSRGEDVCLYSRSFSPCSEMLNSDEEQGVRGVNERGRQERGEGKEG